MRNMVIKGLVVLLAAAMYFNVSQLITNQKHNKENTLLEEKIAKLVEQQETLNNQIKSLQDQLASGEETPVVVDTCNKLYQIEIIIVSTNDDLNQEITHCTNASYLGEALDEIQSDVSLVYDPRYDKDYQYGRSVASFFGVAVEYGEYYELRIDGVYSNKGLDFVELDNGITYTFTLVRWDV